MKLQELKNVTRALELPIVMATNRLRWGECQDAEDEAQMVVQLAHATTCKADLQDHIMALEASLEICAAVANGRYLDEHQRCHGPHHRCEHACTSGEFCESFDERDAHTAILDWLEDLRPFRDEVRAWIEAQLPLQRGLREALWGEGGLFGGAKLKGYEVDAAGETRSLSDAEMNALQAQRAAAEDRAHESMALRVDQYALNLQRIKQLCTQQGDLQEITYLIQEGMPPALRQPLSPSS